VSAPLADPWGLGLALSNGRWHGRVQGEYVDVDGVDVHVGGAFVSVSAPPHRVYVAASPRDVRSGDLTIHTDIICSEEDVAYERVPDVVHAAVAAVLAEVQRRAKAGGAA
jgi:hypothetical protein